MKILLIAMLVFTAGTAVADVYENGADYRRQLGNVGNSSATLDAILWKRAPDYMRRKMANKRAAEKAAQAKSIEEQRFLFLRTLEDDLRSKKITFTVMGFKMIKSKYPDLRELGAKILQDSSKTYNNFLAKQEESNK